MDTAPGSQAYAGKQDGNIPEPGEYPMTTTYNPKHDLYRDEADVRGEMARVFDVCRECRRCVDLCSTFPTLFEMLDGVAGSEAGDMTPAEQDQVADGCFQCTLCSLGCPNGVSSDANVDFSRLMLRTTAMRFENGHVGARRRGTAQLLGRADLVGRLHTIATPISHKLTDASPDSLLRRITAKLTGISPTRLLPTYASERFTTWFGRRPRIIMNKKQAAVTVFPTCLVEYQATDVGQDLVRVYERNGIECGVSEATCCGAPWLHAGDIERFAKLADKNVATLAKEIRAGTSVVIAQPTCSHVVKTAYLDHVNESCRDDAELVAANTYDAAEYLMTLHRGDDYVLDTDFTGTVPRSIAYHAASHLQSQEIGLQSRDLMRLTGARISVVHQSAGVESLWGYRAAGDDASIDAGRRLGELLERAKCEAIAGDCHLANTVITEQIGALPMHPLQLIARAYGIPDEA